MDRHILLQDRLAPGLKMVEGVDSGVSVNRRFKVQTPGEGKPKCAIDEFCLKEEDPREFAAKADSWVEVVSRSADELISNAGFSVKRRTESRSSNREVQVSLGGSHTARTHKHCTCSEFGPIRSRFPFSSLCFEIQFDPRGSSNLVLRGSTVLHASVKFTAGHLSSGSFELNCSPRWSLALQVSLDPRFQAGGLLKTRQTLTGNYEEGRRKERG